VLRLPCVLEPVEHDYRIQTGYFWNCLALSRGNQTCPKINEAAGSLMTC
jgi:hypothetical protein